MHLPRPTSHLKQDFQLLLLRMVLLGSSAPTPAVFIKVATTFWDGREPLCATCRYGTATEASPAQKRSSPASVRNCACMEPVGFKMDVYN